MLKTVLGKLLLKPHTLLTVVYSKALLSKFKSVGSGCTVEWPSKIWGGKYITLGKNVRISWNGWLFGNDHYMEQTFTPEIAINDYTYIGNSCHIVACNRIKIGKSVLIGDRCYISDNVHAYEDISRPIFNNELLVPGEVIIGDECWIGENVCIYGNVTIGKHCVVGANSVLMRDLPDYTIAVGAPARIIKRYDAASGQWRKTDKDGQFIGDHAEPASALN